MPKSREQATLDKLNLEVVKCEDALKKAVLKRDAYKVYLFTVSQINANPSSPTSVNPSEEEDEEENEPKDEPKKAPSLRDCITSLLGDGVERNATEIYAALDAKGQIPASKDPLNYIRSCLAQYFQRAETKGYYRLKGGDVGQSTTVDPLVALNRTPSPPISVELMSEYQYIKGEQLWTM